MFFKLFYLVPFGIFISIEGSRKCSIPVLCNNRQTPTWVQVDIENRFDCKEKLDNLNRRAEYLKDQIKQLNTELDNFETSSHKFDQTAADFATETSSRSVIISTTPEHKECPIGMESRKIPDGALTSSSEYNVQHSAKYARLDIVEAAGGWSVGIGRNQVGEWIQVDLGIVKKVYGIIIQGRPYHNQWVKSFKATCSNATSDNSFITENGVVKIFPANTDGNTHVYNRLTEPLKCRYFRLYPQTWNEWISLRMELLGDCF
ncbi:lactadherin-like [Styela clava]